MIRRSIEGSVLPLLLALAIAGCDTSMTPHSQPTAAKPATVPTSEAREAEQPTDDAVVDPQVAVSPPKPRPTVKETAPKPPSTPLELAQAAVDRDPSSAALRVRLARRLIRSGDLKAADRHATQAVQLAPKSSGAWNTVGRVALIQRQYSVAAGAFRQATSHNRRNSYAWNNLGLTRLQQKDDQGAFDALSKATALPSPKAYMLNNLGIAAERLGKREVALGAYLKAVRLGSAAAGSNYARLDNTQPKKAHAKLRPQPAPRPVAND